MNSSKGLGRFGWNVMCNVDKIVIDVENRTGYLYVPEFNCPDMTSTINCFKSVDAECNTIYVFCDNKPDINYIMRNGEWMAVDQRYR